MNFLYIPAKVIFNVLSNDYSVVFQIYKFEKKERKNDNLILTYSFIDTKEVKVPENKIDDIKWFTSEKYFSDNNLLNEALTLKNSIFIKENLFYFEPPYYKEEQDFTSFIQPVSFYQFKKYEINENKVSLIYEIKGGENVKIFSVKMKENFMYELKHSNIYSSFTGFVCTKETLPIEIANMEQLIFSHFINLEV